MGSSLFRVGSLSRPGSREGAAVLVPVKGKARQREAMLRIDGRG
jgi:hypothetical protein